MRSRPSVSIGTTLVVLGLLVGLAGSYADNLLGEGMLVIVLQVLLWVGGGSIVLAGAASRVALRTGQRASDGRGLRAMR